MHIPFNCPFTIGSRIDYTRRHRDAEILPWGSHIAHRYTETISQRLQHFRVYTGMTTTEPAQAMEVVGKLVVR